MCCSESRTHGHAHRFSPTELADRMSRWHFVYPLGCRKERVRSFHPKAQLPCVNFSNCIRQKGEIELVIRSSQPACLHEGLFCFVLAAFCELYGLARVRSRVCVSALPRSRSLTMANVPVCLQGVVSQKTTTHPGTARFV